VGQNIAFRVLAPPDLTGSIRKVHDFLSVGAAAPLPQAGVLASELQDAYYVQLSQACPRAAATSLPVYKLLDSNVLCRTVHIMS
jgi:hypothetical protein